MFGMSTNIPETLARPPRIDDLGPIPNPEEFSAPCPDLIGIKNGHKDIHITDQRGGFFNIENAPAQFRPAIAMAKAVYDSERPGMPCPVELHLNQGMLDTGRNFRVIQKHFDPYVRGYPDNIGKPKMSFIVSDALTTIFYNQAFKVPKQIFMKIEDMDWSLNKLFAEQADPEARIVPEPYHLMRFDPYAVHEAQLPTEPTQRTMALIRFY
jgi:hypothetical protein